MQAQLNGLLMCFLLRDSRPSQTVLAARCRQHNVARSSLSMRGVEGHSAYMGDTVARSVSSY